MLEPDLLIVERLLDLRTSKFLPPSTPASCPPRTECVILVTGVAAAGDSEISDFFRRNVAPVRDIKRPLTTTDVAFVEFFSAGGVSAAIGLEKPEISGVSVDIKRPVLSNKGPPKDGGWTGREGGVKVYVGGIEGKLLNFTKNDWKEIMEVFGGVVEINFPTCVYTGKGLGGFEVTYNNEREAQEAVQVMNGKSVCGVRVRAGIFV